jgi:hypothetical protein
MYILSTSTVNVHTDFNPNTTGFRGTHRDAELCDFTEPSPDEEDEDRGSPGPEDGIHGTSVYIHGTYTLVHAYSRFVNEVGDGLFLYIPWSFWYVFDYIIKSCVGVCRTPLLLSLLILSPLRRFSISPLRRFSKMSPWKNVGMLAPSS